MRHSPTRLVVVILMLGACGVASGVTGIWGPVFDDPGVFGGAGNQRMGAITERAGDLIAVGFDSRQGDGDAAVWRSRDGMTWDRVPSDEVVFGGEGDQWMSGVAADASGLLVAVGVDMAGGDQDGAVWTSEDGNAWTRVAHDESVFGGDGDQSVWAVTAGGPGFVAVGFASVDEDADAAIWTSTDGTQWARITHDESLFGGGGNQWAVDVAAGELGVITVGTDFRDGYGDPAVWISPDGSTWSRVRPEGVGDGLAGPGDQAMWSVAMGGPGVVAVGYEWPGTDPYRAAVWTSPDGLTWTQVRDAPTLAEGDGRATFMYGLDASDAGLVAVGNVSALGTESDPAVWTSRDGVEWVRVADPGSRLTRVGWESMVAVVIGGDGLVAVGEWAAQQGDPDAAVWMAPRK